MLRSASAMCGGRSRSGIRSAEECTKALKSKMCPPPGTTGRRAKMGGPVENVNIVKRKGKQVWAKNR